MRRISNTYKPVLFLLLIGSFFYSCTTAQKEINWDFWEVRNGTAEFHMEDNVIVGTTKLNTPNTFLCTKNAYTDFVLDVDFWVDSTLNSGIQIRSNSKPKYRNGAVHGYQVEIDPSRRGWTGGIYDEQRRLWLTPVLNDRSKRTLKQHEWNHFHIEAIGTAIRVWLNEQMITYLHDGLTKEGFIGLQVHGIDNTKQVGKHVKWRNFDLKTENLEEFQREVDPSIPEINLIADHLTPHEIKEGWILLGKERTFPEFIGNDPGFEISFEMLLKKETSAAIAYGWNKIYTGDQISFEYAVQDDHELPNAATSALSYGSMNEKVAARNVLFPFRGKETRPINHWQQGRIICTPDKIEHWLNGVPVVIHEGILLDDTSNKNWQTFFRFPGQDQVRYRSIKYRPIKND